MVKLKDIVGLLRNCDRVRIIKDNKDIYTGWLANLVTAHGIGDKGEVYQEHKDDEVKSLEAVDEIKHKKWQELNLSSPLEPSETPDYSFSDLEMKMYYTIHI